MRCLSRSQNRFEAVADELGIPVNDKTMPQISAASYAALGEDTPAKGLWEQLERLEDALQGDRMPQKSRRMMKR